MTAVHRARAWAFSVRRYFREERVGRNSMESTEGSGATYIEQSIFSVCCACVARQAANTHSSRWRFDSEANYFNDGLYLQSHFNEQFVTRVVLRLRRLRFYGCAPVCSLLYFMNPLNSPWTASSIRILIMCHRYPEETNISEHSEQKRPSRDARI